MAVTEIIGAHSGDPRRPRPGLDGAARQRIEAAVLDLFSEQEFHRVRLADVAARAQVSLQTIYRYYGSKETLLFATLDSRLGELAGRMIDHLQGIEHYKDRLRKVFWLVLDYIERRPQVAQIIMSSVYLNTWRRDDTFRQAELMAVFLRVLGEGRAQGALTDEVDEKDLLDVFLGVAMRSITMWLVRGRSEPLAAKAPALFELIWRAIAKPTSRTTYHEEK